MPCSHDDTTAPYALSLFTCMMCAVLGILIIPSNLLIITTIIIDPTKKLRNPFNYFVVNLALSDIFLGTVAMPLCFFVMYNEIQEVIRKGWLKAAHLSYFVSATTSLLTIITLSLDRYVCIMHPSKYTRWLSKRRCITFSLFIWLVSMSASLLYFKLDYIGYLMLFAHITMVAGVLIFIFSHRSTTYLKRKAKRILKSKCASAPKQSVAVYGLQELRFERKITRAFLLLLTSFMVVYIPTLVMTYLLQFCLGCGCLVHHVMRDVTFLLVSCNSVVNPFLYAMRVKAVRKAVHVLLFGSQDVGNGIQGSHNNGFSTDTSV